MALEAVSQTLQPPELGEKMAGGGGQRTKERESACVISARKHLQSHSQQHCRGQGWLWGTGAASVSAAEPTASMAQQCLSKQCAKSIFYLKDELVQQSIAVTMCSQLFCRISCSSS